MALIVRDQSFASVKSVTKKMTDGILLLVIGHTWVYENNRVIYAPATAALPKKAKKFA